MRATMMHAPTTVATILRHGARLHADSRAMSFTGGAVSGDASFAEVAGNAERLAAALDRLGVGPGDRVATLCWNHQAHLEAYLAVPSMGAVLHTLNARLSPAQLAFIVDHAGDTVLILDRALAGLAKDVLALAESVTQVILVGEGEAPPLPRPVFDYATLLAEAPARFAWPEFDDTEAAAVCYTSGTTGDPKGVVYSHRTIYLHSLASLAVDTFGISQADRLLLLPPMFHANCWGLPYSGWLAGSDLLLPGSNLGVAAIRGMIESHRPTYTALVPTILGDLLADHQRAPIDMASFRMIVSGGAAVAPALIQRARAAWDVPVLQGWGMTETSPMCVLAHPPRGVEGADAELSWRSKSGRPVPGMSVRLVDEAGAALPNDGVAVGELQLRGAWVTGSYHDDAAPDSFTADGWLRTGDLGTIDARGYVQVTDRTKDVIKSGGEWISSTGLEAALLNHPAVNQAAVIGIPHEKWGEQPLALIVADGPVAPAALRAFLEESVPRFWLPRLWVFPATLPLTSVGKIDKRAIRDAVQRGDYAPVAA